MPSVLGNTPLGTSIALESDLQQSLTAVAGKPYDAECEYVTFPVGSVVYLGVNDTSPGIYMSATVKLPSSGLSSTSRFICGNWRGSATKSTQIFVVGANGAGGINFTSSGTSNKSASDLIGQFGTIAIAGTALRVGSSEYTFSSSYPAATACDIAIGGCAYTDGETLTSPIQFDLSSFDYSGSGGVRALIPVRVGTVGYLYDKVSGRLFGSATSTALVPGPDVAVPTFTPKTEIDLLAPLDSPAFTGTPTAPTATSGTNTTQVATTAFVQAAIASAVQDLDLSIVSGKLCVSFEE